MDSNRIADWKRAGLASAFENSNTLLNALDFGVKNDGVFDNAALVNQLIADSDSATTLYFPAGFYYFQNSIHLKSDISIIGDAGQTYFSFDSMPNSHSIIVQGSWGANEVNLNESGKKSQEFLITSVSNINVGDMLYVSDNDSLLVFSDWAMKSTGQFVVVRAIKNDTLFLHSELHRNFAVTKDATIKIVKPISNVSISKIVVVRRDSTVSQTSTILLDKAINCEVKCVESYTANFAHVTVSNSLNVHVSGSYFKDAHGYGGGGRGYGVVLQFGTSNCKVYDNVFNHLRHSMLLQAGANGNFVGYNYSTNPFWTETSLPSDASGDLVLHGNYVYANLFEGNVVQNIVIDDSHGINGPNNIFLRNRAENYGLFMNPSTPSDSQLFIGNEITNANFPKGLYNLAGNGHFEYGNNVGGTCTPANTNSVTINSLYFDEMPEEYEQDGIWPIIGYPTTFQRATNLAESRYEKGDKTACNQSVSGVISLDKSDLCRIFPNPSSTYFEVTNLLGNETVSIFNSVGEEILTYETGLERFNHSLPPGIYFIRIMQGNSYSFHQMLVK